MMSPASFPQLSVLLLVLVLLSPLFLCEYRGPLEDADLRDRERAEAVRTWEQDAFLDAMTEEAELVELEREEAAQRVQEALVRALMEDADLRDQERPEAGWWEPDALLDAMTEEAELVELEREEATLRVQEGLARAMMEEAELAQLVPQEAKLRAQKARVLAMMEVAELRDQERQEAGWSEHDLKDARWGDQEVIEYETMILAKMEDSWGREQREPQWDPAQFP